MDQISPIDQVIWRVFLGSIYKYVKSKAQGQITTEHQGPNCII